MIEHDKLPPLPGDLIEAEIIGRDNGYLECIKDFLKSNIFELAISEKCNIKGPLDASQIMRYLEKEMGKR